MFIHRLLLRSGTTEEDQDPGPDPDPDPPPQPAPKTRYYGSVQIDPQRAMRDLSQIADEIIVRLASVPGADVRITVEIEGFARRRLRRRHRAHHQRKQPHAQLQFTRL